MKIIKDNHIIIEIADITYLGKLPQNVAGELKTYYGPDEQFEVFKTKESIEYFKNKDFILDYTYVANLSQEELEKLIIDIEIELERLSKIYLDGPISVRVKLDRNREYNEKIKNMIYKLNTLKKYRTNKNEYDIAFMTFNEEESFEQITVYDEEEKTTIITEPSNKKAELILSNKKQS